MGRTPRTEQTRLKKYLSLTLSTVQRVLSLLQHNTVIIKSMTHRGTQGEKFEMFLELEKSRSVYFMCLFAAE